MKNSKIIKRLSAVFVGAAMMTTMMPFAVSADQITAHYYVPTEYTSHEVTATRVASDVDEWTDGWYVVDYSVTVNTRIEVNGDVNLVVYGDKRLTAPKGIHVPSGSSLTVYPPDYHSDGYIDINPYGSDTMEAGNAAIGGNDGEYNGALTFIGGCLNVRGGEGGAGIGTGADATTGEPHDIVMKTTTTVYATGGNGAAGIGGGMNTSAPNITIQNGLFDVEGCGGAAAIGGGVNGSFGTINVNVGIGSTVTSQDGGAGIGNGFGGSRSFTSGSPAITVSGKSSLNVTTSDGGYAFVCSASDDPSSIPSGTVSVAPYLRITKYLNNGDYLDTKDTDDCFKCARIVMNNCSHENTSYKVTPTGHSRVCQDCRYVEEEQPHVTGPSYCTTCGYGYDAVLDSATVDFSGKLKLVYTFCFSDDLKNDSAAYVEFTRSGSTKKVLISSGTPDGENTVFTYPVEIPDFADKVTAIIYHGDGTVATMHDGKGNPRSGGFEYSVHEYANNMRNKGSNRKMRELAEALYNYGACATNYFKDTSNYSPTGSEFYMFRVENEIEALKESYGVKVIQNTKPLGFVKNTYNVNFIEDNTLRVTFVLDGSVQADSYVFCIDGTPTGAKKIGDNRYALYIPNISAPNLDAEHDFSISYGGDTYEVRVSAMTYAVLAMQDTEDQKMAYLGKALYFYNQKANAYFEPGNP